MTTLQSLLGTALPIIQAPMAGVQGSALALAVSNAGGLGSLPCAMLSLEALREALSVLRAGTTRPVNVNFFCHTPPVASAKREAAWRAALSPYYEAYGIDPSTIPAGPGRAPFSAETADVLEPFRPAVVSFHFGLPSPALLARVRAWGTKVLGSATTIADAKGVAAALALGAAGVQVGTAYLLCPEATTSPVHRAALKSDGARHTALTNVFTGRPARGIVNRIVAELGPISAAVPAFPLATAALAPLRAKAEAQGSGEFSPLWSGQNATGCREIPAAELTRELAASLV
jgi:nitronate monooxygenase